jgi:hypothetical protein
VSETSRPIWLPDIITLEEFGGNWEKFFAAVYDYFHQDFVTSKPYFRGKRLGLKRHPEYMGKSATFWHMISEGSQESERTPDLRRCERIRWPKAIIEHDVDPMIKVWAEQRQGSNRIHLWFEMQGYLVVIDDRGDYMLPWTAFYVEREHQRKKYNKRYERNKDNDF